MPNTIEKVKVYNTYSSMLNSDKNNNSNSSKLTFGSSFSEVFDEMKDNIEKMEMENFYKYPSYQEKLKRAIDDYNQFDGIISDVDFFHNGDSFSKIGCGVASIMYIYAMLNDDFDFNPNEFVSDAINQGYFTSVGSNSYMLLDENLASSEDNVLKNKWGLEATEIDSNAESIISALEEGKKVIFNVGKNDGFYDTETGHYIVLDHYDKETNQIYVFDPAARPGGKSTERMGYQDVDKLIKEMFNIPNNPPLAIESNKVGKKTVESEEQQVIMQEE